MDLTAPVKTEGEASNSENSFIPRTLPLTPTSSAASSSPITPFAPNLGSLSSQLTPEEQTAAYKKANILALSHLAKRGGPNVKDMFSVQQKLQEFLTSLITLAGQKGPQLKVTVQMLVQNLVTGQITEEDFASRIESDLHSQHQPSLLPFLKNSVPHLKTRLQLQQVFMKEIVQRALAEKKNTSTNTSTSSSPLPTAPSSSSSSSSGTTTPSTNPPPSSQAVSLVTSSSSQPPPSILPSPAPAGFSIAGVGGTVAKPILIGGSAVTIGIPPSSSTSQPASTGKLTVAQSSNQITFENLGIKLPKVLCDQIAKLPLEQQKFVLTHHRKKVQQLKEQQAKQQLAASAKVTREQQQHGGSAKVVREQQQKLIREQQVSLMMGMNKQGSGFQNSGSDGKGKVSFASMKLIPGSSTSTTSLTSGTAGKKGKGKDPARGDIDEEEEVGMDILDEVGVNLQEETAQFLPPTMGEGAVSRSCKDVVFLNMSTLRQKVEAIMRLNGVQEISEETLVLLSHATQERIRDVVEKLTEISQHRTEVLKDDSNYQAQSEVRGQLRVLETIDRVIHKRKQERENEQTLRAAKSRSKGADPEKAAKIREEAKQIQQDEATRIRNESANRTALAAIGRKRPLPTNADDSVGGGTSAAVGSLEGGTSNNSLMTSSLFAPLVTTRAPKRHVTSRDLLFYMEQERETRKSLALYKILLK